MRWLLVLFLLLIPLLVSASDPTCSSGDGCKINCQGGDIDCNCAEQFGYICLTNQVCPTALLASDSAYCCATPCAETCNEIWMCTEYSSCYSNNTQSRLCHEITDCGTENKKPKTVQSCTFTVVNASLPVIPIINDSEPEDNVILPVIECTEQWSCQEWNIIPCDSSGVKSRTCIDLNNCLDSMGRKTYANMPSLTQTCEYIAKCTNNLKDNDETDIDCGGSCGSTCLLGKSCLNDNDCATSSCRDDLCLCKENWVCGDWSSCSNGIQKRICQDINDCGSEAEKPQLKQPCLDENLLQNKDNAKTESNDSLMNIPATFIKMQKRPVIQILIPFLLILLIFLFAFLYLKTGHKTYLSLAIISLVLLVIPSIIQEQKEISPTNEMSSWSVLFIILIIYFLLFAVVYYLTQTKKRSLIVSNKWIRRIFFINLYDTPPICVLRSYIASSLRKGNSLDEIRSTVSTTGWDKDFVDKAFQSIYIRKEPETKLTDFLISIIRYAPKTERRIINLLLHKECYTIIHIQHKLGLSSSQTEQALSSLYRKRAIRFDGLIVYLSKIK